MRNLLLTGVLNVYELRVVYIETVLLRLGFNGGNLVETYRTRN